MHVFFKNTSFYCTKNSSIKNNLMILPATKQFEIITELITYRQSWH